MLSLAEPHHYYQNLLSQGFGMGIGMGIMFLPCLTITSQYFKKKRSMAMGVVIAGTFFLSNIYTAEDQNVYLLRIESRRCDISSSSQQHFPKSLRIPMGCTVMRNLNFIHAISLKVTSYRAVAFMDLGFLITANLIMRTRLPPKTSRGNEGGATFKTVFSDVPFLVYCLGAFLVNF